MKSSISMIGVFLYQQRKKKPFSRIASIGIRRRPTLPGRVQPSTIGAEGLNFCVRYGNRWNPFAIATGNCSIFMGPRSVIIHSSYLPKVSFVLWKSSSSLKLSLLPSGLLTLSAALPAHQVQCVLPFQQGFRPLLRSAVTP